VKTFNAKTIAFIEFGWWAIITALFTDSTGEFLKWFGLGVISNFMFMLTIYAIARAEIK
jgi:hypothetical protein